MYETKSEPFKKILAIALCFIAVFAVLSGIAFAPNQKEPVEEVPETIKVACTFSLLLLPQTPPAAAPKPTPEPIVEEPEVDPNPYAELVLTDTEKEWLACMAYSEAGNQEFVGQVAVVQVALNRLLHPNFPDDLSDVLFSPHQFCVGDYYGEQQMEAVEAALSGEPALDLNTDVVFFSTGRLTCGSYYKTIGAHIFRTYF